MTPWQTWIYCALLLGAFLVGEWREFKKERARGYRLALWHVRQALFRLEWKSNGELTFRGADEVLVRLDDEARKWTP